MINGEKRGAAIVVNMEFWLTRISTGFLSPGRTPYGYQLGAAPYGPGQLSPFDRQI